MTSGNDEVLPAPQLEAQGGSGSAQTASVITDGEARRMQVAAELVERNAWLDLFDAADVATRSALALSRSRVGSVGLLGSGAVPIVEFNRAMAAGIAEPLTGDLLDRSLEWLERHAAPGWAVQVAPALASGPIAGLTLRSGLTPSGAGWAKFSRSVSHEPTGADPAPAREAHSGEAEAFGSIVQRGFGLPEAAAPWFAALVGRSGWICCIAAANGRDVAAGAAFIDGDQAWMGIDTTLPEHRGTGLQQALIRRRLHLASSAGVVQATAETAWPASPDAAGHSSFRNYRRAGFDAAYRRPNFKRAPA